MNNKRGCTIIEFLVAMGLITILLIVSIVMLGGYHKKTRDMKRLNDMKSLQTAMILVFDSQKNFNSCSLGSVKDCSYPAFRENIRDFDFFGEPFKSETFCHDNCTEPCQYSFVREPKDNDYQVLFYLEKGLATDKKGCYELTPQGISKWTP